MFKKPSLENDENKRSVEIIPWLEGCISLSETESILLMTAAFSFIKFRRETAVLS